MNTVRMEFDRRSWTVFRVARCLIDKCREKFGMVSWRIRSVRKMGGLWIDSF